MTTLQLRERTEQMLHLAMPGAQNLDEKVLLLLEAEYLHKLSRYRRANQRLERKYGMSFDEFVAQRVVRQQGYSWEVENDAMDWESATGGIITMERLLSELRTLLPEQICLNPNHCSDFFLAWKCC